MEVTLSGLSEATIRDLCDRSPPLVENYLDLETQVQPSGFDLTVRRVCVLRDAGRLGGLSERSRMATLREISPQGADYHLSPGYHLVFLRERLNLPNDIVAFGASRSSLLRLGAYICDGVWDAGFSGYSRCGLVVANPAGITLSPQAAILQVVFFRLDAQTSGYEYNSAHELSSMEREVQD